MYYLNDDHTYRPCEIEEWANQFREKNKIKRVASDSIKGKRISTVWLGIDLNSGHFDTDKPLLFETMIFIEPGSEDIYMDRYSSWDEALEGHKKAIQWVIDGCKEEVY